MNLFCRGAYVNIERSESNVINLEVVTKWKGL